MVIKIDNEKCTKCGLCIETCPINIIRMEGDMVLMDETRCIKCKTCVGVCPSKAIYIK
ncbi:MAG: 4Fe-4S binding protein [Tissierellia bacterium]|nr:4Fe-4S binding protein [Tissierellia bacterium]